MIPHFAFPFDFSLSSHAAEIEQDTVDDVIACAAVAFLVEPGMRVEVPTFGVPSQVFGLQPLDVNVMAQAVSEWENRIDMIITQNPDAVDILMDRIKVAASYRSVSNV